MSTKREDKIRELELLKEKERRRLHEMNSKFTVFGLVCPKSKKVEFCMQDIDGSKNFQKIPYQKPTVTLPLKFEMVLNAITDGVPYIALMGGRNSAKSTGMNAIIAAFAKDYNEKSLCLREHYNSIDDSSYASIVEEIQEKQYSDFIVTDKKIVNTKTKSKFIFKGMARNHNSLKSILGITNSFVDEAQGISTKSLQFLKKTIIRNDGSLQIYVFNPESSADPISEEFINRYQEEIDNKGFFRDNRRLILWLNYEDNPWHTAQAEEERIEDFNTLPTAMYNWIWLGKFLDTVDNALIPPDWFNACVDAHLIPEFADKFKPTGAKIASHDPSGEGDDNKSYALRHGSIISNIREKKDGTVNEGARWAANLALEDRATSFVYDAVGIGDGLREDIDRVFNGINIDVNEYKGSFSPDNKDEYYQYYKKDDKKNRRLINDMFANLKAQSSWELRRRCLNTYKMVILKENIHPDDCISFNSETIDDINKLRSEVCRQPLAKHSKDKIQMMSKENMKKLGISSPNMLDAVVMTMIVTKKKKVRKQIVYTDISVS